MHDLSSLIIKAESALRFCFRVRALTEMEIWCITNMYMLSIWCQVHCVDAKDHFSLPTNQVIIARTRMPGFVRSMLLLRMLFCIMGI